MKLDILFHYNVNEDTGEIKYIGKEEIKVDTSKETKKIVNKSIKIENDSDPIILLEPNKLVLTKGAVDLLDVCPDCRIDIKYDKKEKKSIPVIGTDVSFGTKSGNKLTKSNTVSYRGVNNERLSAYGTTFKLEPTNNTGIFYMIGDKEVPEPPKEIIDIESELDIKSLDDLNIDLDDTNLGNFNFNL